MSRFVHSEFFTVNGLPMYCRHISVYNTNAGNILPKHITFKPNKMNIIHPKQFSCSECSRKFELGMTTTRKQRVDLMQGGAEYFHETPFRTQPPKHIFFNQANSYSYMHEEVIELFYILLKLRYTEIAI